MACTGFAATSVTPCRSTKCCSSPTASLRSRHAHVRSAHGARTSRRPRSSPSCRSQEAPTRCPTTSRWVPRWRRPWTSDSACWVFVMRYDEDDAPALTRFEDRFPNRSEVLGLYAMATRQVDVLSEYLCLYRVLEAPRDERKPSSPPASTFYETYDFGSLTATEVLGTTADVFDVYRQRALDRLEVLRHSLPSDTDVAEHLYKTRNSLAHGKTKMIIEDFGDGVTSVAVGTDCQAGAHGCRRWVVASSSPAIPFVENDGVHHRHRTPTCRGSLLGMSFAAWLHRVCSAFQSQVALRHTSITYRRRFGG